MSLNSLPQTPAIEHASTLHLFHAESRATEDNLAQQVAGLELDQGMRPPKIPPRPVLKSTFEANNIPIAFDHLAYSHPSPSTTPSFSIAGSPRNDVQGLPFPLVPAMPSQPVPQPSPSAVQSETKPKRKRRAKTTNGPRAPRVAGKITKNGSVSWERALPSRFLLGGQLTIDALLCALVLQSVSSGRPYAPARPEGDHPQELDT